MATKTLLPGCSAEATSDCFDVEKHELQHVRCGSGKKCRLVATADVTAKRCEHIEGARDPNPKGIIP